MSYSENMMIPYLQVASIKVQTYYIIISLVTCFAVYFSYRRSLKLKFNSRFILDLSLILIINGFAGARLVHIFFEMPEYYLQKPLEIFNIFNGGYVYYGGLILSMFAGVTFLKIKNQASQFAQYFDFYAPVISLSYAMGRWACFFAGCCYGKYCDYFWAVSGRHPTQIYLSLIEFLIFLFTLSMEKSNSVIKKFLIKKSGDLFASWLFLHALSRLVIEQFRDDFRGPEFLLSVSSWISLVLITASAFYLTIKPKPLVN